MPPWRQGGGVGNSWVNTNYGVFINYEFSLSGLANTNVLLFGRGLSSMTERSLRSSIIFRGQSIWEKWTVVWKSRTSYRSRPCWEIFFQGICVSSTSIRSNSGLFVFPTDASCLKHASTPKASTVSGHATVMIPRRSFLWSYHSSAGFCVHSWGRGGVQFTKWKDHPKENLNFPPEP